MAGLRKIVFGALALVAGCTGLVDEPGSELDRAFAEVPELTVLIMVENDVPLLTLFKSLQDSLGAKPDRQLRIVGDQWGYWNHDRSGYDLVHPEALPEGETVPTVFEDALRQVLGEIDSAPGDLRVNLVLTGHSDGTGFFGDFFGDAGQASIHLYRDEASGGGSALRLSNLKAEFPEAFDRVDRVFLLGCNTGRATTLELWKSIFHNATAVVGFWRSGPLGTQAYNVYSASTYAFDRRLEHAETVSWLHDTGWSYVAMRLYPGGHFEVSDQSLYDQRGDALDPYMDKYESYFRATEGYEDPPPDSMGSLLYEYYNAAQGAADKECGRSATSVSCLEMQDEKEIALRLRFFTRVRNWWLSKHYAELGALSPGLPEILFDASSRAELLQTISTLSAEHITYPTCIERIEYGMHAQYIPDDEGRDIPPVKAVFWPNAKQPMSWGRVINALCGLSLEEFPDDEPIEWMLGLDPGQIQ